MEEDRKESSTGGDGLDSRGIDTGGVGESGIKTNVIRVEEEDLFSSTSNFELVSSSKLNKDKESIFIKGSNKNKECDR